jgi:hypothetical protein
METTGKYVKTCRGCKREFRSDARNARYGPPGFCKCLERRTKQRQKRAKERRAYAKNPEVFRARTRSRTEARKIVLKHFGIETKKGQLIIVDQDKVYSLGCNSPGCTVNFNTELIAELKHRNEAGTGPRGSKTAAMRSAAKKLEAHHRDHNCFNNTFENYPRGSNIELLCRRHHEQADRAKAGKAELIPYVPPERRPKTGPIEWLISLRRQNPRKFFTVSCYILYREWESGAVPR